MTHLNWPDLVLPAINLWSLPSWLSYQEKARSYPKMERIKQSVEIHGITINYATTKGQK